jgi:hypothetical protein
MNRPITRFFEHDLDAPLGNSMWSWGADNGRYVVLRAWQKDFDSKAKRVKIIGEDWIVGTSPSLGYQERMRHIERLRNGVPGFLVICDGEWDESGQKMVIKSYRDDAVFRISAVVSEGSSIHAHYDGLQDIRELRKAG